MVKAIISYKFWVTVCRCKLVFVFLDVCLGFLGGEIHWKSEQASNTGKVSCNKNNLPSCIWEITGDLHIPLLRKQAELCISFPKFIKY